MMLVIFRTLRKDPYTLRGYVTLSVLIKIFNKFGVVINESTQKEIFDKYHVSRSLAAPIWKVIFCFCCIRSEF